MTGPYDDEEEQQHLVIQQVVAKGYFAKDSIDKGCLATFRDALADDK